MWLFISFIRCSGLFSISEDTFLTALSSRRLFVKALIISAACNLTVRFAASRCSSDIAEISRGVQRSTLAKAAVSNAVDPIPTIAIKHATNLPR